MSPKRKTKLSYAPSIQMHSITSLFQKQNEKLQTKSQSTSEIELDDDLQIIKVEIVSPYFKTGNKDIGSILSSSQNSLTKGSAKKRKLSLNKPASQRELNISCSALVVKSPNKNVQDKTNEITKQVEVNVSRSQSFIPLGELADDTSMVFMSEHLGTDGSLEQQQKVELMFGKQVENSLQEQKMSGNNSSNTEQQEIHKHAKTNNPLNDMLIPTPSDTETKNKIITNDEGLLENTVSAFKVPYYLSNFESILNSVLNDAPNLLLFNSDDMSIISAYQALTDAAKKVFIRMFCRKLNWIPLSKLNYPEIAEDLTPYLKELQKTKFLDSDDDLNDLEEVLLSLPAPDIKTLAKSYHIAANIQQKGQLVNELMKTSQRSSISTLFGNTFGDIAKVMIIKAKKYLNGIFKLKCEPRKVFVRVMMLYSVVNTSVDDDTGASGQNQLFQMLMVNMGKVIYPTYTVDKVHNIFRDRKDVIRFEQALQLEADLLSCIQRHQWEKAYDVFKCVEEQWEHLRSDENIERWNRNLPDYLRSFTASSVINRLMTASIDILQRRKDFSAAVVLLKKLLSQSLYNCSHRGYWWERLALNLDAHLKQPEKALDVISEGLADKHVIGGHRLALFLRAESICQKGKSKLKDRLVEFHHHPVRNFPKVFLEGRVLHDGVSTNGTKFLTDESYAEGNSQDMTVCGVEEFVLGYYKKNGYTSGIHAEGSIVTTLFSLFFWDVLFMPLPDAFHSPFQVLPLDFNSESFYERRKDEIEKRLEQLAGSSVEELQAMVEETWLQHEGTQCIGMNWERMRSVQIVKELILCLGGSLLSGILARYARCPRHTRSGFPDLTLWNSQTRKIKICEVKGPGDRLSHKQILWIDYLLNLGIDAEVCHVKAVAAKRLRQ